MVAKWTYADMNLSVGDIIQSVGPGVTGRPTWVVTAISETSVTFKRLDMELPLQTMPLGYQVNSVTSTVIRKTW